VRINCTWIFVFALAACSSGGTSGTGASGHVALAPQGTSAQPYDAGCNSFSITASESGYSGSYTISMSGGSNGAGGTNYSLPPQTSTNGTWLISPGLLCTGGLNATTTQFTVQDQNGNTASTFVSTI
jgi:hypothetical protein